MIKEHQKALYEIDRQKQQEMKRQLLKEKESMDEQMKQNYIKKKLKF